MPFLDHLEELRSRILRSLAAVILGSAAGLWAVQHFQLVNLLKRPIAPYLTDGKLVVLSPTEPVMIVLKLGLLVGLVLASPSPVMATVGLPGSGAVCAGKEGAGALTVHRIAAVHDRSGAGVLLRCAPGPPGSVQLSDRGDRTVHHV